MTSPPEPATSCTPPSSLAERLERELAQSLYDHLRAHGHRVPPSGLDPMLATYAQIHAKRISRRPRSFLRSSLLREGGASERALSERGRHVLGAIERVCEEGGDLNPFLHRRLFVEPAYDDRLLRDRGLHHLHLGSEAPLRKTGLTRRSTEVLLAFPSAEGFHAVDVRLHGRKARLATKRARRLRGESGPTEEETWVLDEGLVEIAEAHWPEPFAASRRALSSADPERRARELRARLEALVDAATPSARLVVGYSDFEISSLSLG